MRKTLILASVLLLVACNGRRAQGTAHGAVLAACGGKTGQDSGADSTAVVTDSLVVADGQAGCQIGIDEIIDSIAKTMTYYEEYALVDVDHDGLPEICLRNQTARMAEVCSIADGHVVSLGSGNGFGGIQFFEHGAGVSFDSGDGDSSAAYAVLKDSRLVTSFRFDTDFDKNDNTTDVFERDGKPITHDEWERLTAPNGPLGKQIDIEPEWHDLPGKAE